ncbi:MAG TPA: hypothetical protein VFV87_16340, partial [Pirellulaceae bacterium]|nr:hypothetical protein [Pirellulaceae bacterium]
PLVAALQAAGPRLVTTDGFGCTSCHQVGGVLPDKAPLNARGPDISMLEKRIRREWFDRWCFSPARIVPRMEMPSVQVPVRGVLGDNVTDQLAAVWQTLNTPGFEPPEPNPIRVLRLSGVPERKESPIVLHDVVKDGDKTYLFPLVIGLPNRHNILFDLETGRLAAWWLGDTARQRTKGKSWWWELGGKPILSLSNGRFGIWLERRGKEILPSKAGQSAATLLESYSGRVGAASVVGIDFPLEANDSMQRLLIRDAWSVLEQRDATRESGFQRLLMCDAVPPETRLCMRLVDSQTAKKCIWEESHQKLRIPNGLEIRVQPGFQGQEVKWDPDGVIKVREHQKDVSIVLDYVNTLPTIDRYVIEPSPEPIRPVGSVLIAEGILGERLPLPDSLMPTALSWLADGRLVFTTLKGQLVLVEENPSQQLSWRFLDDGLATPYGIQGHRTVVDVLTKTGLYRVLVPLAPGEGKYVRREMLASGWGASEDYHDWAVGLVPKGNDDYFLGFPCQQDQRSDAAARFRGQLLHLKSRGGLPDWPHKPRQFDIEVLSSGHRFPMGLAMNRAGDLFVTDNQGNYNPFNELNHVRPGKHFGFINANEKEAGFKPPPLEEPAINIPHPWTRSVNGICFLDTPVGLGRVGSAHQDSPADAKNGKAGTAHPTIYGPLEGHLIGCEYDTRRLIRMSLQKIGDTYQGAAYPLSIPPDDVEKGLLGPIVCAVKPTTGELYIGEIRDSGWGAGNNVGQIVKIKIEPEKLPCGIAEMKATADGFTLDFFQPVDAKKAADVSNYSLQSYRRESTPAYGGPDLDRRTEKIAAIEVSKDDKRVTLKLPELRERFVYELRLKNLAPKNAMFHPDEAHFTLRQVPK